MKLIFLIFLLFPSCSGNISIQIQILKTRIQAKEALSYVKKKRMNTNFCILVDMSVHSGKPRMFVWDFNKKKVVDSGLCAHGAGKESTAEVPVFSNIPDSNYSSLGKYKLGRRSYSNWGIHVHYKMHGLEKTNDNAFKRIIVLHSHTPVPSKEIYPEHMKMGWSQGCPVISNQLMTALDKRLKASREPVLLWIYN